ncbi:MAG: hypothetical protein M3N95_08390 [Actinomycetota bacterium]|nr:hypothetical protein [Actinomycetota bacterium]
MSSDRRAQSGITATNNKSGLVIVGYTVSATVTAAGNTGSGPLPSQTHQL